ncbi:MAG: metallophosphoesterase, partial [Acinetobacter sp.]|nr:metallophosphoesterase [Acinetobacter sp.]
MKKPVCILITDTHLTDQNALVNESVYAQAIEYAIEYGRVPVIHAGDVFTWRKSQSLSTLLSFGKILRSFQTSDIDLIVIPGNHDKPDYSSEESYLDLFDNAANFKLIRNEQVFRINGCLFSFLPFFTDEAYLNKLDNLSQMESDWVSGNCAHFFITHIAINGVRNNDGALVQNSITKERLSVYKRVFCGHYHNAQAYDNICYFGSSIQHNFGEDTDKGIVVLYDDGSIEKLYTSYPRYNVLTVQVEGMTGVQ